MPIIQFIFQTAKESFHNAVVIAVSFARHGLDYAVVAQSRSVITMLILPSLVRMKDKAADFLKFFKRLVQHSFYLLHVRAQRQVVRNYLVCVHVENRRDVAFAPREIKLGNVGRPFLKRSRRAEIPVDYVVGDLSNFPFV